MADLCRFCNSQLDCLAALSLQADLVGLDSVLSIFVFSMGITLPAPWLCVLSKIIRCYGPLLMFTKAAQYTSMYHTSVEPQIPDHTVI
jgi:hypothetical protein